ncbi:MAG: response regulator [Armatimonadetes bacterium]|nr:response regulator [Armatimonadota bacterium]
MEKKIILLIEDNVDDERLTLRALRKSNVMNELVIAADGQQALDYLFGQNEYDGRNLNSMPAVIILDLKLPKLSGLEVLRRIRSDARTKLIPVVVLTSSDDPNRITEAYEAGANSFVRKPSDPMDFSEMILNLAMYWLLLNCIPSSRVEV